MLLGKGSVTNLGSYASLEFNFSSLGLMLLCGPTGCGKSTFLDIPLWILYGQTTKDCSADQIKKWDGDGPTNGHIVVATEQGEISVFRSRSPNDLYWIEDAGSGEVRGKDLNETQRLLSKRLGCDYESFVASCFYHEFSPAATFFTDKAKDRREFFERMANLSLSKRINDGSTDAKKRTNKELECLDGRARELQGRVTQSRVSLESTRRAASAWGASHQTQVKKIKDLSDNFQTEKENKIKDFQKRSRAWDDNHQQVLDSLADKALDLDGATSSAEDFDIRLMELEQNAPKCDKCGAPDHRTAELREQVIQERADNERLKERLAGVKAQYSRELAAVNPHTGALAAATAGENVYADMLEQEASKTNPHVIVDQEKALAVLEAEEASARDQVKELETRLDNLGQVLEISQELKRLILMNTIKEIETDTNRLLDEHFDGEFQVIIQPESADSLEVIIVKEGHECVFRQLSKGQKQLLQLCFSVASMKVAAARAGVTPQAMFFDEPTDGCDITLKAKAMDVFRHISANIPTVLVVEHAPEIQNMFDSRITVSLVEGASELDYA